MLDGKQEGGKEMEFRLLFASSVSACFELVNNKPYYSGSDYRVTVNGEARAELLNTNVFSLFGLEPDSTYAIGTTLGGFSLQLRTKTESACLNVRDFGADAEAASLVNTRALQNAINACPPRGRVKIPAGKYVTGPLVLASDITLELDEGTELLADPDPDSYPVWPGEVPSNGGVMQISSWEGIPHACHQSFLSAYFKRNIVITGKGVLNGNAKEAGWWVNPRGRAAGRPRMLFLNQCEDAVIHGVTVKNSPSWNLHPFFSKNIGFYDINVQAPGVSPNTDGCDPESCDGVNIIGARFSVGDDAVAIKSGKLYMGAKYKTPARAHVIRNCLMEFCHGGVVMGSEMSGGVRDLTVSQCFFDGADRGLRIKTRRGRGKDGIIDGITFENIRMENVLTPLVINMFYFCDADGKSEYVQSKLPQPADDSTPYIGRFVFKDIVCRDCEYAAGFFYGLPEQPIESVTIDNVSFHMKPDARSGLPAMMNDIREYRRGGLVFTNVREVSLNNVTFENVEGEETETVNVGKVTE